MAHTQREITFICTPVMRSVSGLVQHCLNRCLSWRMWGRERGGKALCDCRRFISTEHIHGLFPNKWSVLTEDRNKVKFEKKFLLSIRAIGKIQSAAQWMRRTRTPNHWSRSAKNVEWNCYPLAAVHCSRQRFEILYSLHLYCTFHIAFIRITHICLRCAALCSSCVALHS